MCNVLFVRRTHIGTNSLCCKRKVQKITKNHHINIHLPKIVLMTASVSSGESSFAIALALSTPGEEQTEEGIMEVKEEEEFVELDVSS